MIFTWDARKATSNVTKHGIDFHEAASVLNDTLSTTFPEALQFRVAVCDGGHVWPRPYPGGSPRRAWHHDSHHQRPDAQRATNEDSMKKANRKSADDMLPEYDFSSMKGGVRGKYAAQFRAGTNLVLLDPEVAEAFPTAAAVNQALRAVLRMTRVVRLPTTASHTTRRKRRA